jgi:UDP-N-acetylmuramoyl-tripeptide--D-alanyl-D-alanine ligase
MYTFSEIAEWASNGWKNDDEHFQTLELSGISHDTRTLKPGEVYIAIRGENHDGHDFVEQAAAKGAVGVIVEKDFPNLGKPRCVVPDTRVALWQIAAGTRAGWTGTVIGITGSAGKTTVKEMVAAVLSQKGTVSKTFGNWNNDIGLPLSMIAAGRDSDFFVFELGMNHPGEIELLSSLLKPDWALVTNIGKAHIGFFQSLERIADEKASILEHAKYALLDQNSEWFDRMKRRFDGAVTGLTDRPFRISQSGAHMIQNARFAATIGLKLGLTPEDVQAGLDSFEPAPMRWAVSPHKGILFINDAYNANPLSMRAAISTFAGMPCEGRKFLVLGGMLELGDCEEEEHRLLGELIESFGFDRVITIGPLGGLIACRGAGGITKEQAAGILREELREGDAVLLKASRGARLETILEQLKAGLGNTGK